MILAFENVFTEQGVYCKPLRIVKWGRAQYLIMLRNIDFYFFSSNFFLKCGFKKNPHTICVCLCLDSVTVKRIRGYSVKQPYPIFDVDFLNYYRTRKKNILTHDPGEWIGFLPFFGQGQCNQRTSMHVAHVNSLIIKSHFSDRLHVAG